jgi:histidinol-phosphate aminotransferase
MKTAARFDSFLPYQSIVPYEILSARLGRPADQLLKLDANENPYGPSPKARQALAELAYANIYPDPESRALRAALAGFTDVPIENLLAGAGADELIDLLLRVLLETGDRVLVCPPTFSMYAFDTRLNAGEVINVPRNPDFSLDLENIRAAVVHQQPKIIFMANPNNPDGRLMTRLEIERLLELPALIVLDEAYIEFTDEGGRLGEARSWIRRVPQSQNLVVLRTFSKWAGLAGLRVGYGAFPSWLLPTLWKAKQPYNVNLAASAAAIASLDDLDCLAGNVARLRQERSRLFARLQTIPYLEALPSQANFILCRVKDRSAAGLQETLAGQGILVRRYDTPQLSDCIRISAGTPQGTERLSRVLLDLIDDRGLAHRIAAGWTAIPAEENMVSARTAFVRRETRETQVEVHLALDGSGKHSIHTGLGFFDHMLAQVAVHGLFDLEVSTLGDLEVDPHHTIEDTALTLGEAFAQALGERRGIVRMGSALVPMDDSLAEVVIDLSGRPYAVVQIEWHAVETGGIPNSLWTHFLESFSLRAGCTLFVTVRGGRDDHHQVEAVFKGLGRALDAATRLEPRRRGQAASSKGTLAV